MPPQSVCPDGWTLQSVAQSRSGSLQAPARRAARTRAAPGGQVRSHRVMPPGMPGLAPVPPSHRDQAVPASRDRTMSCSQIGTGPCLRPTAASLCYCTQKRGKEIASVRVHGACLRASSSLWRVSTLCVCGSCPVLSPGTENTQGICPGTGGSPGALPSPGRRGRHSAPDWPLWRKDYCQLAILSNCRRRSSSANRREIYIHKGNLPWPAAPCVRDRGLALGQGTPVGQKAATYTCLTAWALGTLLVLHP